MREDCGVIVIDKSGRILAANSLAELLLGHPLPPNVALNAIAGLPHSLTKAGFPIESMLGNEKEKRGFLKGDQPRESELSVASFPLFDGASQVWGTIITLVKREAERVDPALKFLGLSHHELMDQLPEGVFMVNARWQINYFNETAQRITGLSKREALGKFCWEVFRGDLCRTSCPMRVSINTGEVLVDQEVQILSKTGEKKVIMINSARVRKLGDKILGGLATFHECDCAGKAEKPNQPLFSNIIGVSSQMRELFQRLPMIAASDSNVLIHGESGTGKELVAQAVHHHSPRRKGPFIAINCSAVPDNLLESELFGHERGAFTGAVTSKCGRFELAKGGALFLDEIGDLKPNLQVKLLRALEERTFERVGGTRQIPLEARIIAATNVDLKEAMRKGTFREDLYYRLFTVPIHMAPLRERRDDIPILVRHFVELFNRKFGKNIKGVDPKVMKILCRHAWPGNVRELQHTLEHCFVFAKGSLITERHLPSIETSPIDEITEWDLAEGPLQTLEKKTIIHALETTYGSKQDAAKLLKISRSKLWRKMKAYNITEDDFKSART